jgi:hypothetical protein
MAGVKGWGEGGVGWGLVGLDKLEAAELFAGVGGAVGAIQGFKLTGEVFPLGGVEAGLVEEGVFEGLGGLV